MRIISGSLGGRKIHSPAKMPYTRPTTDIAKEGLFNILQTRIGFEGIKTLDLFGGTGSISYELASRGAGQLTIVENDAVMHQFIKKNIADLKIEDARVIKMNVFNFLSACNEQFDFIFAGPPYALATIDDLPIVVFDKQLLKPGGWFVLEHTPRNEYEKSPHFSTTRKYGTTVFTIFVNRTV
jgi:16S rRNA (guanine966-N2)-methyltransferase